MRGGDWLVAGGQGWGRGPAEWVWLACFACMRVRVGWACAKCFECSCWCAFPQARPSPSVAVCPDTSCSLYAAYILLHLPTHPPKPRIFTIPCPITFPAASLFESLPRYPPLAPDSISFTWDPTIWRWTWTCTAMHSWPEKPSIHTTRASNQWSGRMRS